MKKDIVDEKTQSLCTSQCLSFIDNSSIYKSCLNRSKQHLNRRGSPFLGNNFKKFVNSDPFPEIYQRTQKRKISDFVYTLSIHVNHGLILY